MIVEELIELALLRKLRALRGPVLSWQRAIEKGGNGRGEGEVAGIKRREGDVVVVVNGHSKLKARGKSGAVYLNADGMAVTLTTSPQLTTLHPQSIVT